MTALAGTAPGGPLATSQAAMAEPAITSTQWLARVALVVLLAASEVVLAVATGVGIVRALVLAVAMVAFVIAYVVMPSPGKASYERRAFHPVYAMAAASLVAVGATGGYTSPLLPVVAVPIAIAWTLARPHWRDLAFAVVALAVLAVAPAASFTTRELALLAGWATILTTWAIGRRVAELREMQRAQAVCLARIREGALLDAESRRRGMEVMTTKLAHELKNPLAAIKSLTQVEAKQAIDDKSRRRLEVVLGEIERMGKLIGEYLDLARPIVDASLERIDLAELMTDVSSLVAGRAEAAGIDLSVEGRGGAFEADGRLLKEALVNVVCNAIEATPRGGRVSVRYQLDHHGASVIVRDSGRGMTKDTAARIGTPFFTTRANGTGLGVVIARTAIAQHGGTLAYESTPGIGTIATIALPIEPHERKRASA